MSNIYVYGAAPGVPASPLPPPPSAAHYASPSRTAAATAAVAVGIFTIIAGIFCEAPVLIILGFAFLVGGTLSSRNVNLHYPTGAHHRSYRFWSPAPSYPSQPHYQDQSPLPHPSAPPFYHSATDRINVGDHAAPFTPPPPPYHQDDQRIGVGDGHTNQGATLRPNERIPVGRR